LYTGTVGDISEGEVEKAIEWARGN